MPYFAKDASSQYMPPLNNEYGSRYGHGYPIGQGHNLYGGFGGPTHSFGPVLPDPYDQFKSGPAPMTGYEHGHGYLNAQHLMGAPYMPPVRIQDRWGSAHGTYPSNRQQGRPVQDKDEKAVGGVSAKLDYEMEQMTDFVVEMTVGMYELLACRICIADIDLIRSIKPGMASPPAFRSWVKQVLNATRLPSATIILSLSYMSLRVRHLSDEGSFQPQERSLYQMLTVALILGSKFLDDNTFQNKSWAEVSNITVSELNKDEREWLSCFGHRLHHDPERPSGFKSWEQQWLSFKTRTASSTTSLHPLDTNVRRQRSIPSGMSSASYDQFYSKPNRSGISVDTSFPDSSYATPTYSAYDGWYGSRSASERSPPTAPHSGPHTPEYYGQQAMWNGYDAYAHRQQYALPALSGYAQQPSTYQTGTYQPAWNLPSFTQLGQNYWNCHGAGCQCAPCRSVMPARYGSVMVG